MSDIIQDILKKQRESITPNKKLSIQDFKRLNKYIDKSIFDDKCTIWNGYKTILNKTTNASYNNFYFNGKKHALHRLLYVNFVGDLEDCEYIKFNCSNKGQCCNVNHLTKIQNNKKYIKHREKKEETLNNNYKVIPEKIIVHFDFH